MPIINARVEGEKESFSCSSVSEAYNGVGYLVCGASGLVASTSSCACAAASCQSAGCAVTTGALMEKNGKVSVANPPVPMMSGRSTSFDCQVLPGHRGTAMGTCVDGVFSADVSQCTPKPCVPSDMATRTEVGVIALDVVPPYEVASGSSWNLNCAGINSKYEGSITATCRLGEVVLQNGCFEAPCNDSSTLITLTDSNQMTITLTGSALGFTSRTPSAYNNTGINCGVFNSSIDGTASVQCSMGDYTVDASGCGPRGCTAGSSFLAQLGSREISATLDVALNSKGSTTRSCASVVPGWTGTYTVRCSYGTITGEASGCSAGTCAQGDTATVIIGGKISDLTIDRNLNSFESINLNCSTVNSAYLGAFSLTCEAGVVFGNTSGCEPVPVAGTSTEARQVLQSAVAFQLPEVEATVDEMQAAMDTVAVKRAYELTLAESFAVDNEDVTVFSVQVYDPTAGRRLQAAKTRLSVNVNFQLRTKGSQVAQEQQVTSLKAKIQDLGTSGSAQQQSFAVALGSNLEEAVKVDQQNSALLRVTAQAVKAEGITVKHVETPRLTVSYVVVEVLEPEEPGPVIVNIIAAIFGIISAGACAALVIWQIKKRQMITPIAMLDESALQEVDAEAPETPASRHLRTAGQPASPVSLQMQNAVNSTNVQVQPTTPFMNDSRDPEPFWTAQDAEVQDLDGHQVVVGSLRESENSDTLR